MATKTPATGHLGAPIVEGDLARHAGDDIPSTPIPKPPLGDTFQLDEAVAWALALHGIGVMSSWDYGMSLWGHTAKLSAKLPHGEQVHYFLKAMSLGSLGRKMIEGEFESLKALNAVSPQFIPKPYTWGRYKNTSEETYYLLTQFREVGKQPPDPALFTNRLADLHKRSMSPTGKFGFHITTCHAKLTQITDVWEESWARLYQKQLAHMFEIDEKEHGVRAEFRRLRDLTIEEVIPRLSGPLQTEGRSIKPCLVHGDLWDENTATDAVSGEPFIFDAGSFYAHNEYEIGNWRAARHRLSSRAYVESYLSQFPPSQPEDEWDDRNMLYSLRFDMGTAILIPNSNQRENVQNNMLILCKKYVPEELDRTSERAAKEDEPDIKVEED